MTWEWVDNPAYAVRRPTLLEPDCHDRSPMLDVQCTGCGATHHYHETQIARVPPCHGIRGRCPTCQAVLEFAPGTFEEGFAEMRRRGWIA
jgi:hypothetical protein